MSFLDELKKAGQRVIDAGRDEIDDIFQGGDGSASAGTLPSYPTFPTFPNPSPATGSAMEPEPMPAQSTDFATVALIGLILWAVLR